MRQLKIARQFYLKTSVVALAIVSACATAQKLTVDPAAPGLTTVYIVRHAEKSTMVASDPDPDLTSVGQRRAEALASRLGTAGVTAIIATQFKRTQETAQPLAAALRIQPEIIPAGARSSSDSVAAAVLRHRGGKILIVGHSNTIPGIIEALGGPRMPTCATTSTRIFSSFTSPHQASLSSLDNIMERATRRPTRLVRRCKRVRKGRTPGKRKSERQL